MLATQLELSYASVYEHLPGCELEMVLTGVYKGSTVLLYVAQALALGFVGGWLAHRKAEKKVKDAFILLVQMEFKSVADRVEAEEAWKPEALECWLNEPGTLSYELARSDKNERMIIFIERYADKEDAYLAVHKGSAAFAKFRPEISRLDPKISGESYIASDIGYMSRAE